MTEQEQKRLYEHFKKLAVNGETDIQREKAKKNADEILNSFPKFESAPEKEIKSKKDK